MALMYLIAIIPAIVGAALWVFNKKVVWFEWLIGMAAAFLVAGLCHLVTIHGMTSDKEIWSGVVREAVHTPWWRAEWQELEIYTTTDSEGNSTTHTRMVTKSRTYPPTWTVNTDIGEFSISEADYDNLHRRFGEQKSRPGHRPDFDRGDRNFLSQRYQKDQPFLSIQQ
mgnify:CR=1 FL=1